MGCKESKVKSDEKTFVDDTYVDYNNVIECPPRYPSALAPTTRRKDVFYPEKFKEASERIRTVPTSAFGDFNSLLKHLLNGAKTETEKLWSIYFWVVNQNFDDPNHGKYSYGDTPKGYMRMIYDGKGDVATLFAILCRRARFKCVIVDGISKGGDYEVGMPEQELVKMRDRWNAVYLDKNWRFAHPLWGSKASDKIKNYFFMTEPEEFNTWCRPDDREWQLLTTMVTMSEFVSFPYNTAEFYMMNMKVLSPKTGKVKCRNGHTFVEISTTRNVAKTLVVKFSLIGKKLMKPKPAMNGHIGETTDRGIITSRLQEIEEEDDEHENIIMPTEFPSDLENFVFMWRKDAHFMFDIRLPVSGIYLFTVQAGHVDPVDYSVSDMVIVTELKLYCFDNVHEEDIDLFPVVPEIGWGVTPHCTMRGIRPVTHVDGEVFVLPDADTVIRFELDHEYEFDVELMSSNFAEDLQKYVSHEVHNSMLTIKVRIPGEGQYGLKIYSKEPEDEDFINVCNYFLVFNKISSNIEKFPKRMLRERLEKATENGSIHVLKGALDDFKMHNVPDRGEVKKAKDKIKFFEDQRALSDAIKRKNPTFLKKAISDGKNSKFATELKEDIKRAELMLAKLNKMEGYLHPIAKLELSTLAEIRKYTWPPEVVKNVLTATYVLLGEEYEFLQDWDYIQSLMAKVGRDGLKNKVLSLDPEKVPQHQVDLADIIIEPHKLEEAREASTGTAALYQWVRNICNDRRSQRLSSADTSDISDASTRKIKIRYPYKEKGKGGQFGNSKSGYMDKNTSRRNKAILDWIEKEKFPYDNRVSDSNKQPTNNSDLTVQSKKKRNTNISSQAKIPKDDKKDNIVGMIIINEKNSRSPSNKRSPSQKSPASKTNSPPSKTVTPNHKSPANKYIPSQQNSPANSLTHKSPSQKSVNKSPAQRSPNQKTTQRSPNQKSPHMKKPKDEVEQRFQVIKPSNENSINQGKAPHNKGRSSPSHDRSPSNQFKSHPNKGKSPPSHGKSPPSQGKSPPSQGKSPPSQGKSPPSQGKSPPSQGKSPPSQGKSPPSQGKSPPSQGKSPPSQGKSPPTKGNSPPSPETVPVDAIPHRPPLRRPDDDEILSPRGLSPISDKEMFSQFSPISEEQD